MNEELKISDKEITLDDYELTNLTSDGFVIKLKNGESYKVYKGSILPGKFYIKKDGEVIALSKEVKKAFNGNVEWYNRSDWM